MTPDLLLPLLLALYIIKIPFFRSEILLNIAQLIEERVDAFAAAESRDQGKSEVVSSTLWMELSKIH